MGVTINQLQAGVLKAQSLSRLQIEKQTLGSVKKFP